MDKVYICIDLKSFYASVECRDRGLDPLNTNLVVADKSRTEKTICLAVSPSLKKYGLSGRSRLFEVVAKVKEINALRKKNTSNYRFKNKSYIDSELMNDNDLALDYIIAPPRMRQYMKYSTQIYNIYLKYVAPEDIFVYSIDEVFCDITYYLGTYNMTPEEFVAKMIQDVYDTTGITATAGIGSNLFLCKIAMDIVAKHSEPNEIGVRIASLNEQLYRQLLWNHKPLTDFWRVGRGIANKLEANGMYTMGDVALCSIENESILYKLFGINAELLIDHAWGYEPCTIKSVKAYKPSTNSISSGQVLHCPYTYEKTKIIIREMADLLSLDLVAKHVKTKQLTLTIGYDIECLKDPNIRRMYKGEITTDHYGRCIPKHSHGTINLPTSTSSTKKIVEAVSELFERIVNNTLLVRRINISANNLKNENEEDETPAFEQVDLFTNYEEINNKKKAEKVSDLTERELQRVVINIKNKYGKNAILKGMNLQEGGTTIVRNGEVGGHRG